MRSGGPDLIESQGKSSMSRLGVVRVAKALEEGRAVDALKLKRPRVTGAVTK